MSLSIAYPHLIKELAGRCFLSTRALSQQAFDEFLSLALAQKQGLIPISPYLRNKIIPLVFFNPSLRTRVSMAAAIVRLGGHPIILEMGSSGGIWGIECRPGVVMDGAAAEHIREAAPVLGGYGDALGVRAFPNMHRLEDDLKEPVLTAFAELTGKPIINLESATEHPCQALADMLTIRELYGSIKKRKITLTWAYHPKALPLAVPFSFALAAAQCGAELTIAAPPEFHLPQTMLHSLENAAQSSGARVQLTHDRKAAAKDAEVIYAKSWCSPLYYGATEKELDCRIKYKDWMVDETLMQQTNRGIFMHCLPVRRNVVVSDGVLDGQRSRVLLQAQNRLHAQMTLLTALFSNTGEI